MVTFCGAKLPTPMEVDVIGEVLNDIHWMKTSCVSIVHLLLQGYKHHCFLFRYLT